MRRLSFLLLFAFARVAFAASPPAVDSFVATPAVPAPGQTVTLQITSHDPDCASSPCSACGTAIRSDLLAWSDDTNRTPSPFSNSAPSATGSPWSATVTWIAPPAEGTYTVRATLADNGGMLCGGRQTKIATLQIVVSNARPPVIDSFTVAPQAVPVGGTATMTVVAHDAQNRPLTYAFSADAGTIAQSPSSSTATWTAPQRTGRITLRCSVTAGGVSASAQTGIDVSIGSYLRTFTSGLRATRIAPLLDGRIALVDGTNGVLAVSSLSGAISWSRSGLRTPIAVAARGSEIFVVERSASRISVWSTNGDRLRELPLDAALPNSIAAGEGELAIADTEAARVLVISPLDGHLLRTIGSGMLRTPTGVACANGRVAVADSGAAPSFSSPPTARSSPPSVTTRCSFVRRAWPGMRRTRASSSPTRFRASCRSSARTTRRAASSPATCATRSTSSSSAAANWP